MGSSATGADCVNRALLERTEPKLPNLGDLSAKCAPIYGKDFPQDIEVLML